MNLEHKKIILYTRPTCGMCMMLKERLKQKNIKYEVIDDEDTLIKKGISHVPVLEIDGTKYENFKDILNLIRD